MPFVAQVAIGKLPELGSSATTTTRRTAPACATTSTWSTWPAGTWRRWIAAGVAPGLVTYNLGTGRGYSVLEMVRAFERRMPGETGPYRIVARRPGDIAACYADPTPGPRGTRLAGRTTTSTDMVADALALAEGQPERLSRERADRGRTAAPRDETPLRILQVVHGLPRGGLENGVVNLLNGLPCARVRAAVCCLDSRGEMADRRPGVPIDGARSRRHDLGLPLQRLARVMREVRPDLVHCRNWNTWPTRCWRIGSPGGRGAGLELSRLCRRALVPAAAALASRLLSLATDTCSRSAATPRAFAALSAHPPARFEVLYNGVDCRRFAPSPEREALRRQLGLPRRAGGDDRGQPDPGQGARACCWRPRPGAPERAQAALLVARRGCRSAALERRHRGARLGDRVQMPGGSDRVPQFLAAADLFVLPSELEGMSNAILEAMASGCR
jgi:glycosyltransferase involved in cell wall biosynthesis